MNRPSSGFRQTQKSSSSSSPSTLDADSSFSIASDDRETADCCSKRGELGSSLTLDSPAAPAAADGLANTPLSATACVVILSAFATLEQESLFFDWKFHSTEFHKFQNS
jgi:hypothetical protein